MFGVFIAQGGHVGLEQIARVLAKAHSGIHELLRPTMALLIEEVRLLEALLVALKRELAALVMGAGSQGTN